MGRLHRYRYSPPAVACPSRSAGQRSQAAQQILRSLRLILKKDAENYSELRIHPGNS
jgi:hypothetical protein